MNKEVNEGMDECERLPGGVIQRELTKTILKYEDFI